MNISSNYSAPLGLPNGQVVPSRGSVTVTDDDWSAMKDHRVVKAWLDEKKLSKGAEPKEPEPDEKPPVLDSLTDDELRIFLKDGGVNADGRWGRDKLLAEAKKVAAKD